MHEIGLGDLVQFGLAAPFVWYLFKRDAADRAERAVQNATNMRLAMAVERLCLQLTGHPLEREPEHVQPG